jgi:hypothetical protein
MDLIYLDYNCFQRGFDDPGQGCATVREGGELRPKGPTVGKEKSGITFLW